MAAQGSAEIAGNPVDNSDNIMQHAHGDFLVEEKTGEAQGDEPDMMGREPGEIIEDPEKKSQRVPPWPL